MSEQVQVTTFENYKDVKSLAQWVAEKNDEQQRFIKASEGKWDDDRVAIVESRNKELEAAQVRLTQLQRVEDIYNKTVERKKDLSEPAEGVPFENNGGNQNVSTANGAPAKSLGEIFTDNRAYKEVGDHESFKQSYAVNIPDFTFSPSLKTVMTTSAGYAVSNPRTDRVVPFAQREPRLADMVPVDQTTLSSIKYMEETTALAGTNAQVSITEGSLKFENALAFTERTVPVETVGTWLPVTNQQLDDVPGVQGIINNRLTTFLQLKEEDLLLNGTGTPPQITGFLVKSGTNTQARGTDTNLDCIFKAMQAIRVTGFAEPDGVIMHPDNFTPIRLYKDTAGNYSFDVINEGGIIRLFGKTLVLSPAMTSGTALVGSFGLYSHISRRMGMTVVVGLNSDDFTKNKKTILGEFRESLEIYRAAAFTKCTGLQ